MTFRPWGLLNNEPVWLDTLTDEQLQAVVIPADAPRAPQLTEALWNDRHYVNMRASDGTPIDSRTKHREYMRQHGVTTVDDFNGSWKEARRQRDDFYKTGGDRKARKEAVERAIYELNQKRG